VVIAGKRGYPLASFGRDVRGRGGLRRRPRPR
jgi:hypothetical protein